MDISNIPNEFHKEIIDKDGQKIVFDFKDLDKAKKEYIRLTQDEYDKLKECATKRKKVNFDDSYFHEPHKCKHKSACKIHDKLCSIIIKSHQAPYSTLKAYKANRKQRQS